MMACHEEILSSLFDGEPVDPDALADALAAPGAADLLLGFARLRLATQQDASRPGEAFYALMQDVLRPHPARRLLRVPLLPLSAVAALVICGMLGVWLLRSGGPASPISSPPTRHPVVWPAPTVPGPTVSAPTTPAERASRPPTASRTLRFIVGRDWHPVS